jgi:hypothetical protein
MKERENPIVTRRDDLIKAFITKRDLSRVDEVPKCFGSLPEGNNSAWAKGCIQCPLYTDSESCSNATEICNSITRGKKYKLVTKITECDYCEGSGELTAAKGSKRPCRKCEGVGKLTTHTMELEMGEK